MQHPFQKNRIAKQKQIKAVLILLSVITIVVIIGYILFGSNNDKLVKITKPGKSETLNMTGVVTDDFTSDVNESAISKEERQITALQNTVQTLQKTLDQASRSNQDNLSLQQSQALQLQALKKQLQQQPTIINSNTNSEHPYIKPISLKSIHFSYPKYKKHQISGHTSLNYVPSGTFVKAILLGGADANASVNGTSSTTPVLMRILASGTLPNGAHSHLKGCFALASIYGDVSSERGLLRLQSLSCTLKNHQILDIPVEGTVFGMGGKNGITGPVVMRNGKLLTYAGLSGALSGIGGALQQSLSTQTVSPLGTTTSVAPSHIFQAGAYGGANTALSKMADYYIKRADQYHPVIEVSAGSVVDIVFEKGFSLKTESWGYSGNQNNPENKPGEFTQHIDVVEQSVSDTDSMLNHQISDMKETQNLQLGEKVTL